MHFNVIFVTPHIGCINNFYCLFSLFFYFFLIKYLNKIIYKNYQNIKSMSAIELIDFFQVVLLLTGDRGLRIKLIDELIFKS